MLTVKQIIRVWNFEASLDRARAERSLGLPRGSLRREEEAKMKQKQMKFLTPVKFVLSPTERKIADQFTFKEGQHFLFLGEIPGMSGHCAVVDRKGKVHWAYHIENFKKLTRDEI